MTSQGDNGSRRQAIDAAAQRAGRATARALKEGRQRGIIPSLSDTRADGSAAFSVSDFATGRALGALKLSGLGLALSIVTSQLLGWSTIGGWLFAVTLAGFVAAFWLARANFVWRASDECPSVATSTYSEDTLVAPASAPAVDLQMLAAGSTGEPPQSTQLANHSTAMSPPRCGSPAAKAAATVDDEQYAFHKQATVRHYGFDRTSQIDRWIFDPESRLILEDGKTYSVAEWPLDTRIALSGILYLNWLNPIGSVVADKVAKAIVTERPEVWQPQLAAAFRFATETGKRSKRLAADPVESEAMKKRIDAYCSTISWTHASPNLPAGVAPAAPSPAMLRPEIPDALRKIMIVYLDKYSGFSISPLHFIIEPPSGEVSQLSAHLRAVFSTHFQPATADKSFTVHSTLERAHRAAQMLAMLLKTEYGYEYGIQAKSGDQLIELPG